MRRLLVLAGIGLLSVPLLLGCGGSTAVSSTTASLDHVFVEYGFNGSVLIARDGRILLDKGYGQADRDRHVANRPDTVFRIGSVTKQFTAMAVLLLQERGRLRVQDTICDYLADCPPAWRTITIHQLLTHTSGIPDITTLTDLDQTKPISAGELQARLAARPLDFAPGARFSYSNSGYLLLGTIVERASGMPYRTYLREAVLTPLHLAHSSYDLVYAGPDRAIGYLDVDNPAGSETAPDLSLVGSAGALASTVGDLYRWDQALFGGTFASSASRQQMLSPQVPMCTAAPDQPCPDLAPSYGYGWTIGREPSGRNYIAHEGSIPGGFGALNEYLPDQRVTVVLLSNSRRSWANFMRSSAPSVLESILFPK